MLYRIYTEDKNRAKIIKAVRYGFGNFTVYSTIGFWKGKREKSLTIEIIADVPAMRTVALVAKNIKKFNKQKAVLIQKVEASSILI